MGAEIFEERRVANFITCVLPRSLYDSFSMVWGSECVNGISP